jgi:hypothetical protein
MQSAYRRGKSRKSLNDGFENPALGFFRKHW